MRKQKRYAGDWLPVNKTAIRKARCKRRFKSQKSEMQLISEKNRRNSW